MRNTPELCSGGIANLRIFALFGDSFVDEINYYISHISLEDILYSALAVSVAAISGYVIQCRSAKDYIRRYKIDKISQIPEGNLDMGGIESVVSSYKDKDLKNGWPFRKRKNQKKLSGNYDKKELISPDVFL